MGINRHHKYIIYILTAIIICGCLSPVYAEVPNGVSWVGATCILNSPQVNLYDSSSDRKNYSNFDYYGGTKYVSSFRAFLYEPIININQPVCIFALRRFDTYGAGNNRYSNNMGPTHDILPYDSYTVHDNNHVYTKTYYYSGNIGFSILWVPYLFLVDSYVDGSGTIDNLTIRITDSNSANTMQVRDNFLLEYIGCIDLTVDDGLAILNDISQYLYDTRGYTQTMMNDLHNLLYTTGNIKADVTAILNLLQNQQSTSDATQAENQTTSLHNDIDLIQNNNMIDVNTNITNIMQNPDYNMSNPSIISGASYITAIANNIFTNAGVFSWAFVFPAFIALAAYVMGRVGLIH